MESKFKVGQKVQCCGNPVEIIARTNIGRYHVRFKNGNAAWVNEADLTVPAKPAAADEKKAGA